MSRLLILLAACSSVPEVPPAARIPEGAYTLTAYVRNTEGTCEWIEQGLMASLSVDSAGQISSPLPGASCSTAYAEWITFTCNGFGARLTARGSLQPTGAQGTGEVRGSVGGCTYASFSFQLSRR